MRVNTDKALETAKAVFDRFGSWQAVREASVYKDGKYVISMESGGREDAQSATTASQKD